MKKFVLLAVCLCFLPRLSGGEEISLAPSLQIYDRYGVPMRGYLSQQQTYFRPVELAQVSPWLILAAVSAEDKRFFMHPGVDYKAVLRAAWQNAKEGEVVSGASTITQQLARVIEPRPRTLWGKAKEAWNALLLERGKTKEEILEEYFNLLEFGALTQGVEAASNYYFGCPAAELSVAQAATLAGMIQSPVRFDPVKHPQSCQKRRNAVLRLMRQNGFIDQDVYQMALAEPLTLQAAPRPFSAPHFTRYLAQLAGPDTADIYSTLDARVQTRAAQIVQNQLARFTQENVTNAAAVVLDNRTGGVLAYVGSADFNDTRHAGQVDGVRALRQPGSALKPFVYALGMNKGFYPSYMMKDEDTFFEDGYRPRNYDGTFHGWVSARKALACSYNIPAVKVAAAVGAPTLLAGLRQLGLTTLNKPAGFYGLGLSLGAGEVRLLDLAGAYATLARGGLYKPVLLAETPVIGGPGAVRRVFDERVSFLVTDMLKDNAARADAFGLNSPLQVPFEMAAKTGTSKDYRDNFAVGYTPRWTVAVWAGNFDGSPMRRVSGIAGAAPILHDLAVYMQSVYPSPRFTLPDGVKAVTVCAQSGLPAGKNCTRTQTDYFLADKLPDSVCDGRHQALAAAARITFPQNGDVFKWDPAVAPDSQQILFQAEAAHPEFCQWVLDKKIKGQGNHVWWKIAPGKHRLVLRCGAETDTIRFEVLQ